MADWKRNLSGGEGNVRQQVRQRQWHKQEDECWKKQVLGDGKPELPDKPV